MKALNLKEDELKEKTRDTKILADYGYFNYESVDYVENSEQYELFMPNKEKASHDKDKLRLPSQRKTNGYGKHDMAWNPEKNYYICPEGQNLTMKHDIS